MLKRIITFGSMNMDLSIQTDRIPNNGETIQGSNFFLSPGGKGANQTVAASKSGANTWMVGGVGDDLYGTKLLKTLKEYGVNCEYVKKIPHITTGVAMIIRNNGDNRIIFDGGANELIKPDDIDEVFHQLAHAGDIFLTQFETDYQTVLYSVRAAKNNGLFTIINPAPAKHIPDSDYQNIDLLIINQWECKFLSGIYPSQESEYKKAIEYFQQKGAHTVLITLGAKGSVVGEGSTIHFTPGLSIKTVDTTAAGDTYIGALACSLSHGKSMKESMDYATKAAALTVSKRGAQESIPTKQQILKLTFTKEEKNDE
ncbi:ribokinase [Virgibacillus pantothenticus]|nr:ribokinase [Virgibacillus pantothenticus]